MRNIKLIIAYCGTHYAGWQKTRMGPSIEETLQKTLEQILQQETKLQAASRTDAGVHAEGQVVNFILKKSIDLKRLKNSLNGLLPKDIAISDIVEMPASFHPTLDCKLKEYHYSICYAAAQSPFFRDTSWHFPYELNLEWMRDGARHFLGTHDFSAFCNERKLWDRDPVCSLQEIRIVPCSSKRLSIVLVGDHFLYRMARNIAGTLAYIGCGKIHASDIPRILQSKERSQGGVTAPAHGLILKHVFY